MGDTRDPPDSSRELDKTSPTRRRSLTRTKEQAERQEARGPCEPSRKAARPTALIRRASQQHRGMPRRPGSDRQQEARATPSHWHLPRARCAGDPKPSHREGTRNPNPGGGALAAPPRPQRSPSNQRRRRQTAPLPAHLQPDTSARGGSSSAGSSGLPLTSQANLPAPCTSVSSSVQWGDDNRTRGREVSMPPAKPLNNSRGTKIESG